MAVVATGQFTISDLNDGENGQNVIQLILTNENHTLTADSSGTITSYAGASTGVYVYDGATDVTSQYTISKTDPTGVTTQKSGNTITVTSITNGVGGTVTVTATKNSTTLTKSFNLSVSKAGASGERGSLFWTSSSAPLSNTTYDFNISSLSGETGATPEVGDIVLYSYYRYTITTVSSTTVHTQNRTSIRGPKGDTGDTGPAGQDGAPGQDGADGSQWYQGTDLTGTSGSITGHAGAVDDQYLNSSTGDTYICVTAGDASTAVWNYSGNIKGATGSPGSPGADAKLVTINPSSQVFKSTTGASGTFTPQYIYLYPTFQSCSYSKWQYSTNGTTWTNVTSGSNSLTIGTYNSVANSLRIERTCNLYTDSITSISFKCISNVSTVYDIVSIIKIYDVTDLQIGGRNLLLETGTPGTITGTGGTNQTGSIYYLSAYGKQITKDISSGWQFTFSFDWETDATSGTIKSQFGSPYYGQCSNTITVSSSNTSGHSTYSGVAIYATQVPFTNVYFRLDNLTGTVTIKNAKLEIGNIETDWTPAPEDLISNIDYIVGTQTASTNAFTGVASFPVLRDGQQITYWLPYAGTSSNATLNLTLSTGSTTGAKNVYYGGTTMLTTHYPAGSAIRMIYRENVSIAGSTTLYTGWWCDANYDTNNTDRLRFQNNIKMDQQYVASSRLIAAKENNLFSVILRGTTFKVNSPILFTGSNLSPLAAGNNNYLMYSGINIVNNLTFRCDVATETITSSTKGYSGNKITGTSTTGTVFSNSGITAAVVGDLYINTDTYYLYKCTLAGNAATAKWAYVKSLYTPVGKRWYSGTAITGTDTSPHVVSGSGVSSAGVGDYYYNTSTGGYYECTLAGNASTAKWKYNGILITQYETIYLRGTLNNKLFTVADVPLTTTIPTTDDGYYYISLGTTYSLTAYGLFPEHPMYKFVDGEFKSLNQVAVEAQADATDALDKSVVRSSTEPNSPKVGMLWFNTETGALFMCTATSPEVMWETQDLSIYATNSDMNNALANKNRTYIEQPTPPYNVGDSWIVQDDTDPNFGKILTCVQNRLLNESFNLSDWIIPLDAYTTLNEVKNVLGTDPREWSTTSKSITTLINENTNRIVGTTSELSRLAVRASDIEMSFSKTGTMNFLGNSSGQNGIDNWTISVSGAVTTTSASSDDPTNNSIVSGTAFQISTSSTVTMTSDLFVPPTNDTFIISLKVRLTRIYSFVKVTVYLYSDADGTSEIYSPNDTPNTLNIPYAEGAEGIYVLHHLLCSKNGQTVRSARVVIESMPSYVVNSSSDPNTLRGKIASAGITYKYSNKYYYIKPYYQQLQVSTFIEDNLPSSASSASEYNDISSRVFRCVAENDIYYPNNSTLVKYMKGVYYTNRADSLQFDYHPISDSYYITLLDSESLSFFVLQPGSTITGSTTAPSTDTGYTYIGDIMVNGGQTVQTWTPRQDENLWGENIKFNSNGITIRNKQRGYGRILDSSSDVAFKLNNDGTIAEYIWQLTDTGFITKDIKCYGTFSMGTANASSSTLDSTFIKVMEMKRSTSNDGVDDFIYVNS